MLASALTSDSTIEEVDVSTADQMTRILLVLVRCFESLRQCTSGGYITCQLSHKYARETRANLKREWDEYRSMLVAEIAAQVMSIV